MSPIILKLNYNNNNKRKKEKGEHNPLQEGPSSNEFIYVIGLGPTVVRALFGCEKTGEGGNVGPNKYKGSKKAKKIQ